MAFSLLSEDKDYGIGALTRPVTALYVLLAISAITGSLLASSSPAFLWLHYLTKPTATALLLAVVLRNRNPVLPRYRQAIALGLAFAIGGDVFLMLPQDYFLAGLICFLLTHCAYIYALTRDAPFARQPVIFLAGACIGVPVIAGLWGGLPSGMEIPVIIYATALVIMAAQAISRTRALPSRDTRIAAIGAVLFVISDMILAYARFRFAIPLSPIWVLGTYYSAQWCLAHSVMKASR